MMISNNGVETLYYGYADNQGSLIALTDASGSVVEKYAYDPWGARRDPADWRNKDSRTSFITNRGYTGHEQLDAFGIINMNGRVYDPQTAMFFSPDAFIQSGGDWKNYNRYSYCMNNPTRYTDPSGYKFDGERMYDDFQRDSWGNYSQSNGGSGGHSSLLNAWDAQLRGSISYNWEDGKYEYANGDETTYGEAMNMYGRRSDAHKMSQSFINDLRTNNKAKTKGADASNSDHDINLLAGNLKTQNHEGGLFSVTYGKFKNDLNEEGVQMEVVFWGLDLMSNSDWGQTVSTNFPLLGGSDLTGDIYGMFHYNDDSQGGNGHYYSSQKMSSHIAGTTVYFEDAPRRQGFNTYPTFWSAELTLMNNGTPVLRINYGYTIDNYGCHPIPYTYYIYH